jgi:hypothetical protein
MARSANVSSRQSVAAASLSANDFLGDPARPGIVVLGAHYVTEQEDAADSDSNRLRWVLLSTSIGRFCGITYGDMAVRPGFFKHNFKPGIPTSDADIVCLDYFWMQRGGDWIKMRYGNNWLMKMVSSFSRCPRLQVFLVPNASELFGGVAANELVRQLANSLGSGTPPLLLSLIDVEEATSLHPLVVATVARDGARGPFMARWETEGRVHSLQIERYAPEGFLAVHRFANDAILRDYLRGLCTLSAGAPPAAPPQEAPEEHHAHCPDGHEMVRRTVGVPVTCDGCSRDVKRRDARFSCPECDFDYCLACGNNQASAE